MTTAVAEDGPSVVCVPVSAVLDEFAQVMIEWGHYRTAEGLRFPTPAEISDAAVRRLDRGWSLAPLP